MKTFLTLLLDASLAMALLYGVYWLFLRKETFFRINRYYLLGAMVLSVLLPLIPVHYAVTPDPVSGIVTLKAIAADSGDNQFLPFGISGEELFLLSFSVIYFTGVILFLSRLLFQSGRLFSILKNSESFRTNNVHIVKNHRYNIPFSFFNFIFYNPDNHNQEDLAEILVHEKVHIRERHWIDLLVAELWSVVFWFNPFVWLYERSIRQNHEYLADAGVLAQGRPVGRYQALLINQLMGGVVVAFANHLNFSLNTTRFKMMTKKETPKIRVMRITWALPVVALLLVAFAEPDYRSRTAPGNDGSKSSSVPVASEIKVSGKIVKPDGTPLEGTSVILMGTNTGTMSGADGTFELRIPANQQSSLVFSFVGYVTKVQKIEPVDHDVTLKTNQMVEAVFPIDKQTSVSVPPSPPPPPPPPSSGDKVKKNSSGSDTEEVFIVVEKLPKYPGGEKALQFYIQEMTAKTAQANGLKGKALVEFVVNAEGNVADVTVKSKDNDEVAKAAVIIVSGMKQWEPGAQRGKPVPVKYVLPLEF